MMPALIVPSVRPVNTTIAGVQVGTQIQFTFRQNLIGGGFTDYTTGPVWSSAASSIASVDATGIVTGQAVGSTVITATLSGATASFTVAVTGVSTVNEVSFLRAHLGGDAGILGFYSVRGGITQSSGKATQWDDIRGASNFGPSLTLSAGTGFPVTGTDPNTLYMTSDGVNALQSAVGGLFSQDTPKCLVFVGTVNGADATGYPVALYGTFTGGHMAINENVGGATQAPTGYAGAFFQPGTHGFPGVRAKSSKIRLFVVWRDGGTNGYLQVPPSQAYSGTIEAAPNDTHTQLIIGRGGGGSGPVVENYRAVLVLSHMPSAAEIAALQTWARNSHGAVNSSSKLIAIEGDSLAVGFDASTAKHNVESYLLERAFYAAYDDVNYAISGSLVLGGAAAISDATRVAAIQALYDASRTKNILPIWCGTNDLNALKTGAQTQADLWAYVDARVSEGWKPLILTSIPRNAGGNQATFDAQRAIYNAGIVANAAAHGALAYNLTTDSAFSSNTSYTNLTYYNADGVHLTDAGCLHVADLIDATVQGM